MKLFALGRTDLAVERNIGLAGKVAKFTEMAIITLRILSSVGDRDALRAPPPRRLRPVDAPPLSPRRWRGEEYSRYNDIRFSHFFKETRGFVITEILYIQYSLVTHTAIDPNIIIASLRSHINSQLFKLMPSIDTRANGENNSTTRPPTPFF